MKQGDLVKTNDGRFGIVKSYNPMYNNSGYPCYVFMPDVYWRVEYFKLDQIEVICEA